MGAFGLHWITVATLGGYVEFLIFIGFITGAVSALGPTTIPFISPNPETLGMRIGVIYAAAGLGTLIGNPIALATAGDATIGSDATRGDFLGAQLWMGICSLVGAAFFVIPAKHAKKNQEAMWSSS